MSASRLAFRCPLTCAVPHRQIVDYYFTDILRVHYLRSREHNDRWLSYAVFLMKIDKRADATNLILIGTKNTMICGQHTAENIQNCVRLTVVINNITDRSLANIPNIFAYIFYKIITIYHSYFFVEILHSNFDFWKNDMYLKSQTSNTQMEIIVSYTDV